MYVQQNHITARLYFFGDLLSRASNRMNIQSGHVATGSIRLGITRRSVHLLDIYSEAGIQPIVHKYIFTKRI